MGSQAAAHIPSPATSRFRCGLPSRSSAQHPTQHPTALMHSPPQTLCGVSPGADDPVTPSKACSLASSLTDNTPDVSVAPKDFQKLSKAHREAQGKEQLMLARICELERLLAVVNPNDEIVQLDDTYSVRVRTSTSSLDDPPSSPTSADRSERAPALGAVATAEAADGVSIVEPLRLSASVARHADDPRHAARHAGHQNNANSAGAPGVSSEPVQGATPPTTLVNGGGGVGGGTVSGGLGGPGGGSASAGGGSQKASTPGGGGRRRAKNLSVVPEEVVTSSGSPTQEGATATAFLPVVDEERDGAQRGRGAERHVSSEKAPRQQ
ncbi:MAG: hypothetical protein WDW38_007800 [Sanguina aurantia]